VGVAGVVIGCVEVGIDHDIGLLNRCRHSCLHYHKGVAVGEKCSTGCKTRDHASFGECMRSKRSAVMGLESTGNDYTREKQWQKDLDFYSDARRQGIQPDRTDRQSVQDAVILSDVKGEAYQA